jgi:uncharacterized protein DUF6166
MKAMMEKNLRPSASRAAGTCYADPLYPAYPGARQTMRTYHGERTQHGCEVTVDGRPLRMRSDLSGNATTAFDWGYAGSGQLSLALLSDLLGDDRQAQALVLEFEQEVIASLPHDSWTLTDRELAAAVVPLAGAEGDTAGARAGGGDEGAGAAFGDMPVRTTGLVPGMR